MSAARKNSNGAQKGAPAGLSDSVSSAMKRYFRDLDGHAPGDLYDLVMAQVEKPLIEVVLHEARGNVSQASRILGLNRATLRNRLKKYGLEG